MQFNKPFSLVAAAVTGMLTLSACNAQEPAKAPAAPAAPAAAAAPAAGTPGVMAKVNGVAIPESRLEFLVKQQVAAGQPDSPELRKAIRERLISQEVVAQAAVKKGLEQNPDIAHQIELTKQELLANAYLTEELKKSAPSDELLKKEYDAVVGQMGKMEYKAHHILVATEDEAKKIIADLKKGAKFEKLAEKSKDTGSAKNGGDLGWFPPEQMVKPFSEALGKLQKGQTTQTPVQTQFGWHVIRLDDSRARQVPPFDQVKPQLAQQAQRQQIQQVVQDLRTKAKVE